MPRGLAQLKTEVYVDTWNKKISEIGLLPVQLQSICSASIASVGWSFDCISHLNHVLYGTYDTHMYVLYNS